MPACADSLDRLAAVARWQSRKSSSIQVAFSNLSYTVQTKEGPVKLLSNVFGFARPGRMTALMVLLHTCARANARTLV